MRAVFLVDLVEREIVRRPHAFVGKGGHGETDKQVGQQKLLQSHGLTPPRFSALRAASGASDYMSWLAAAAGSWQGRPVQAGNQLIFKAKSSLSKAGEDVFGSLQDGDGVGALPNLRVISVISAQHVEDLLPGQHELRRRAIERHLSPRLQFSVGQFHAALSLR